ncbi:MAG: histidine kinase [Bacteroidota bacterium]|nr:histidine kinase [Bacteroidota bacterium]
MKQPKTIFYSLFVFLLHARGIHAQTQHIKFNLVEGINGVSLGKINGITQDAQGFMWFADQNNNCITRYDGYRMISYRNDPFNANSLGGSYPECIFSDSSGIIWIGFYGMGFDRFNPDTGIFTHYRHKQNDSSSLSNDFVTTILVDHKGVLWIGTDGGLDLLDQKTGRFKHYPHKANNSNSLSNNRVRCLYEDHHGELWVGTGMAWDDNNEGGLNRLNRTTGTFTCYLHDPKNPNTLIDNKVRAIFEDSRGNFWIGTRGNGLHLMNRKTGTFKRYSYNPAMPESLCGPASKPSNKYDHITFITEDIAGALWIGTAYSGLEQYDTVAKKITHFGKDNAKGFTDRSGWCAYTSHEGVLWISTQENNLFRIDPTHVNIPHYDIQTGVTGFCELNGILWFGTGHGLVRKDRRTGAVQLFMHDPANSSSVANNDIASMVKGTDGKLLIAPFEDGLDSFDPVKQIFTHYRHDPKNDNSLISDSTTKIYVDRDGYLWIGTWGEGLDYMNPETHIFTHFKNNSKDSSTLSNNNVSAIYRDHKNILWIGTLGGGLNLMKAETRKFKHYLTGFSIFCIYEDSDSIIWVGTNESLYRYNRATDNFTVFAEPGSAIPFTSVTSMLEDDQNNLWLSTISGLIKLNRKRSESSIYGKHQGVHRSSFFYNSVYKGPQNELFFADENGYYAFFPEQVLNKIKPPKIVLINFLLDGQTVRPGANSPLIEPLMTAKEISLNYHQNTFSFDFAAIDYRDPQENRHLFMLEGYDNTWRNSGAEHTAYYYNVPPGNYVFKVKAANSNGVWTERSIKLVITPPWWSNWWLRIAALLFVIVVLYGFIRWRLHQKFRLQLERSEKEKLLAEMRHKTSELEMQALRSQMNPHFIFNSLNSINRFILQNDKAQASGYLTKFSRLVRLILQNSQSALITLESELESLQLYLELEAVRFDHHFDFKITVSGELETDIIKVPPLIIQPYAENAIWHGLMHKEEKGHLEIEIFQSDDVLCCKISDDGIGRKKAAELKSKSASTHKSMGMQITASRIEMLQQKKQLDAYITVNDLLLPDGSAGGTEVILKIPVHYD